MSLSQRVAARAGPGPGGGGGVGRGAAQEGVIYGLE